MRRTAIIVLALLPLAGCGGTQATQPGGGTPTDDAGATNGPGDQADGGSGTPSGDMTTTGAPGGGGPD